MKVKRIIFAILFSIVPLFVVLYIEFAKANYMINPELGILGAVLYVHSISLVSLLIGSRYAYAGMSLVLSVGTVLNLIIGYLIAMLIWKNNPPKNLADDKKGVEDETFISDS